MWEVGEVLSYLIQAPMLMSPGACCTHGTIVDFDTMRSQRGARQRLSVIDGPLQENHEGIDQV